MREGYLKIARNNPSRVQVVDASGSTEHTHSLVMALVLSMVERNNNDR